MTWMYIFFGWLEHQQLCGIIVVKLQSFQTAEIFGIAIKPKNRKKELEDE